MNALPAANNRIRDYAVYILVSSLIAKFNVKLVVSTVGMVRPNNTPQQNTYQPYIAQCQTTMIEVKCLHIFDDKNHKQSFHASVYVNMCF